MVTKMEYTLYMNRPASWWNDLCREATPLGNGFHGAMIYGNARHERIMLSHTQLWAGGKNGYLPDVSDQLAQMRHTIAEGDILKADGMLSQALHERGYDICQPTPIPAGDLRIHIPMRESFSKYSRRLQLNDGLSVVQYNDGADTICSRTFVSKADDIVVTHVNCNAEVVLQIHYSDQVNGKSPAPEIFQVQERVNGQEKIIMANVSYTANAGVDTLHYGIVVRVINNQNGVLIISRVLPKPVTTSDLKKEADSLQKIVADFDTLFERHAKLFRTVFERCTFQLDSLQKDNQTRNMTNRSLLDMAYDSDLPNALTEKLWAYGRYLMISSSDPHSLPCSLTSMFSGDYMAFWGINMANINLEMIYWQTGPGQLSEYMLSVFDYYDNAIEDMKECARKLYGCRGIYLSAVSVPGFLRICCPFPHIVNWTGGAAWVSQMYVDYWHYTGDDEFMKNRAYPFLRETALFYEDFLIWNDSKWHVIPSISPENHTSSFCGMEEFPEQVQTSVDATLDIALIKALFHNLLDMGQKMDVPAIDMKRWQQILDCAPDYQYNEDGSPREWLDDRFPDREQHRHQSHLYPVFPGLELARENNTVLKQYQLGGMKRMRDGLEYQTSWSFVQNACLMARCRDGENAYKSLCLMARSCLMENLLTLHNDWRDMGIGLEMPLSPFQIDANMGFSAAVQEMLLYSDQKQVELLPALPSQWSKGKIGPLATRCHVLVTVEWENGDETAAIVATDDVTLTLHVKGRKSVVLHLTKGEEYRLPWSKNKDLKGIEL